MHQIVKRVVCPIIHGKLGHQEPFGWLVVNDVRAKRCGKCVIQPCTYGAKWGLRCRVICWWQF